MVALLLGTKKLDILSKAIIFKVILVLKLRTTAAPADLLSMDNFFHRKMVLVRLFG